MSTGHGGGSVAEVPADPAATVKLQTEGPVFEAPGIVVSIEQKITVVPPCGVGVGHGVAVKPMGQLVGAEHPTDGKCIVGPDP